MIPTLQSLQTLCVKAEQRLCSLEVDVNFLAETTLTCNVQETETRLKDEIESLRVMIQNYSSDEKILTTISKSHSDLIELKEEMKQINTDMNELKKDVKNVNTEMADIKKGMGEEKKEMKQINTNMNKLQVDVKHIETQN